MKSLPEVIAAFQLLQCVDGPAVLVTMPAQEQ